MQNNNHEFIFNRYEEKERLQLGRQHNHAIKYLFLKRGISLLTSTIYSSVSMYP